MSGGSARHMGGLGPPPAAGHTAAAGDGSGYWGGLSCGVCVHVHHRTSFLAAPASPTPSLPGPSICGNARYVQDPSWETEQINTVFCCREARGLQGVPTHVA